MIAKFAYHALMQIGAAEPVQVRELYARDDAAG